MATRPDFRNVDGIARNCEGNRLPPNRSRFLRGPSDEHTPTALISAQFIGRK
jgi:hypothetical protein